jgi:hypothetical protein
LDHALEYRDGDSIFGETDADWDSAEGRAHCREAALVDAITGGRFLSEVEKTDLDSLLRRRPGDVTSDLYRAFPCAPAQALRSVIKKSETGAFVDHVRRRWLPQPPRICHR